jgi:peptidoglycan/LPS O-acetylase OafA/YrhL
MAAHQSSPRIAGLDVLRALAIALVLVAHYPKAGTGLLTRALNFGWSGVDLFFVLSGYLIGGQLFAAYVAGQKISLAGFYARRWLRTLPNYYVVLALYFLLPPWIAGGAPAPVWKFLSFTQNLGIPSVFKPSWSLCVEEQFYLLFPMIAFWLIRKNSARLTVAVFGGILAAGIALRAGLWFASRPDALLEPNALTAFMGTLYYPTWCRLDGISLGVGLAAMKCFRPVIWERLMDHGNSLLATSVVFLGAAVAVLWGRYSLLCSTVGFTLLSLSFTLLTASVLTGRGLLARCNVPGARTVSLLSYSIYLTHSLAIESSASLTARWGLSLQSAPGVGIAAVTMMLFAVLLYYIVERPGLALRDRLLSPSKPRIARSMLEAALEPGS